MESKLLLIQKDTTEIIFYSSLFICVLTLTVFHSLKSQLLQELKGEEKLVTVEDMPAHLFKL